MFYKLISGIFRKLDHIYVRVYSLLVKSEFKSMKGIICHPNQLKGMQYISVGEKSRFEKGVILTAWNLKNDPKSVPSITIGDNCNINEYNHITACSQITIGDNLLTGRYVYISDNSHGSSKYEELLLHPHKRPLHVKGPVVIGDNVWICEHACILSGVTIGDGAIIAANAVVTHDVPPYCVAAGVPAKVIKCLKD